MKYIKRSFITLLLAFPILVLGDVQGPVWDPDNRVIFEEAHEAAMAVELETYDVWCMPNTTSCEYNGETWHLFDLPQVIPYAFITDECVGGFCYAEEGIIGLDEDFFRGETFEVDDVFCERHVGCYYVEGETRVTLTERQMTELFRYANDLSDCTDGLCFSNQGAVFIGLDPR